MDNNDNINSLRLVKRSLIRAHTEITEEADFMETRLTTEYDRAMSKEYGAVCRILGILEEATTELNNQITKLNNQLIIFKKKRWNVKGLLQSRRKKAATYKGFSRCQK